MTMNTAYVTLLQLIETRQVFPKYVENGEILVVDPTLSQWYLAKYPPQPSKEQP